MTISVKTFFHFFLVSAVLGVAVSYSKLYLFRVALVLLLSIVLTKTIQKKKIILNKQPTKYHYIFYFMFTWYLLSILWSINILYSATYLFYIICGLAIIYMMLYFIRDLNTQNKVFRILSIVFIIEVFLSLMEALTDFRLPVSPYSSYISFFGREAMIEEYSLDVINYILQSPTGFQWNPNNLAVTMLIISPFFLLHKKKAIRYIGILSIFLLIFMSGSRGIFIAFSFMILLYLFILNKKRFLIYSLLLPFIFLLIISNIDFLKSSDNKKVRELANSFDILVVYLFEEQSSQDSVGTRKQLISNGIAALKESNYMGVGGGGSIAVQEYYGEHVNSMHNFWIEILVDSGVIFFSIFMFWYIKITLKLYMIAIHTKHYLYKYYSQSLFLSMSSFVIGAVSASSVIYLLPMWLMFGFSIVTINNYERYKNELIAPSRP